MIGLTAIGTHGNRLPARRPGERRRAILCAETMNPSPSAKACPTCGQPSALDARFCSRCGHTFLTDFAAQQTQALYSPVPSDVNGKKIAAGICGILVGEFGIHKFILGYSTAGVTMLLVSVLTCGIGGIVMSVIGIVEGILYLTKSDQQFYSEYVVSRKEWF